MEITTDDALSDGGAVNQSSALTDVEVDDHMVVKLFDVYYDVEEENTEVPEPIVYLRCRDGDGGHWPIEVTGFHPYFCVERDQLTPSVMSDLDNDHRVRGFDLACDDGVEGEDLAKITVVKPYHVRELRDFFGAEHCFEADVAFPDRFLIDSRIKQYLFAPSDACSRRVHVSEIESADEFVENYD